jgi:serine/threonine protein kinase
MCDCLAPAPLAIFRSALFVCTQCSLLYRDAHDSCSVDDAPLSPEEGDSLKGADLDGRYVLGERISAGAMGVIYRAQHAVLAHEYAIKILFGEYASNPSLIERFRREARAISQLRHENIVAVTDFGQSSRGFVYLVMEYVDGGTLEGAIDDEAPFPPERAIRIGRQIAAALGEAHRVGYVHRDVKPSNVMLAGTGEHEQVKLLDFGLVGIVEESDDRLTKMGMLLGTPRYMAPEQCLDSGVTEAADLYSLGVVLYEMLTGRVPFDGDSVRDILMQHLESDPPPLPPLGGLEKIVGALLEKKPRERPATADEVIAALAQVEGAPPADPHRAAHGPKSDPKSSPRSNRANAPLQPTDERTGYEITKVPSQPRSEISAIVHIEAPVEWTPDGPTEDMGRLAAPKPEPEPSVEESGILEEPELPARVQERITSNPGPKKRGPA